MRKAAFWLTLASILVMTLIPYMQAKARPEDSPSFQSSAYDLIAAVNALRAASGLPEYSVNSILMGTAQAQADFMASTGSITHSGPGGIGLTQRLLNAGYPLAGDLSLGGFRAENITAGPGKSANQAVQEWLGDAAHINTMVSPNLQEIGAGVAVSGGTVYYVIDCARPASSGAPQAYTPGSNGSAAGTPGAEVIPQYMAPVLTVTPDEKGLVYHEVLYGQSLWSLAIAYGVKIDEIRSLNNLSPDYVIQTGDRLLVRKDAPPLVTATFVHTVTPIMSTRVVTTTSFPTVMATTVTGTSAAMVEQPEKRNSVTGTVIAIVLVALLLAGMLTWLSARKPAR